MTEPVTAELPRPLRARIAATEQQLLVHRRRVASLTDRLEYRLRARLSSPSALMLAAALGVMLAQTGHHRGRSLLRLLNTVTGGSSLVLALLSRMGAGGSARPGPLPRSDPS